MSELSKKTPVVDTCMEAEVPVFLPLALKFTGTCDPITFHIYTHSDPINQDMLLCKMCETTEHFMQMRLVHQVDVQLHSGGCGQRGELLN